jgi:hypothetical protein
MAKQSGAINEKYNYQLRAESATYNSLWQSEAAP